MKKLILGVIVVGILLILAYIANYLTLFQKPLQPGNGSAEPVSYKVEEVVSGLMIPWDIVFTSDSRMLVTERSGSVRVVENNRLVAEPLYTFEDVATGGEEGLMGLAVDPNYGLNKQLYVCYAYENANGMFVRVVSAKDNGSNLSDVTTIIENIPAAQYHAGCQLAFGPDDKLYITTGDATDRNIAQDLSSLGGKILRLNKDGSIPNDNPFGNSPVWSYGHRNPQGIAWNFETDEMYATEHGPSGFDGPGGGDEVNRIVKGSNYGWPLVSHEKTREGTESPLLIFTPAEAPGSAMVYSGNVFPQFKNNLFFGALRGEGIIRVVFHETNPDEVASFEKLGEVAFGRIRAVVEGPDGYIYFSTSNRDGRGSPRNGDDRIYRLIPE